MGKTKGRTREALEDMILDLTGRLELSPEEIEQLQKAEEKLNDG